MLKVNEIFGPTIQGEGKSVGQKVFFLRLAGCNLHCIWCDTPYTWNWIGTKFVHPLKFDPRVEIHSMSTLAILNKLQELGALEGERLVISGGEPLLQQKELEEVCRPLKAHGWFIEVETNGTIAPTNEFDKFVDQFNCSPKLSNSGDPVQLRVKHNTLSTLVVNEKVNFKFVVETSEDIDEVLEYVATFEIEPNRIYLMPLGKTREELNNTREATRSLCDKYKFNFSDRLHIVKLGGGRGV